MQDRKRDSLGNLRPAGSMSRWVLGPGFGLAGREWARRCCESEGRGAYDGQ